MGILTAVLILACTPTALLNFAIPKWRADKAVRAEDAYKWLYQATRGGEHAVPDEDSARKWLDDEWDTVDGPVKNEPEWEPLCPGGEIGRLNLRPYRARGGKEDDLLQAFLASSREYRTDGKDFLRAWGLLGKRLKRKMIGSINYRSWCALDEQMKQKDYPAVHHSKSFQTAHHPAYRVITAAERTKLLP